jgi:hypothetical protein
MNRFLLTLCFCALSPCFLFAQKKTVPQELLPVLNTIPSLEITIVSAKKTGSCKKDSCCASAAVKTTAQQLDNIETKRWAGDTEKFSPSKNTFQLLLNALPQTAPDKTILLGNKTTGVLTEKPVLFSESNKKILATGSSTNPVSQTDTLDWQLKKLLLSEMVFRNSIKKEWQLLQKEYNTEVEMLLEEKKDREAELNKMSRTQGSISQSDADNLENEFAKKFADNYAGFMKNKAQPLMSKQKQQLAERYSALENNLKRLNYGIGNSNAELQLNIVDGQTLILDMVHSLTLYAADCIVSGCELARQQGK